MVDFKSIVQQVKGLTSQELPFMEGREKAKENIASGEIVNISDYGFMKGDDGEFVVFITKENEKEFYFGSSVLTQNMKDLEKNIDSKIMGELLEQGLEVVFGEKMSKNKRKYVTTKFFPSQV